MSQKTEQQVIALAAIVQAASLVEQLARSGEYQQALGQPLIEAILNQSPDHFEDIYGRPNQLSLGLNNLNSILGEGQPRISPDIARYTLSLLHLEAKLRKQPTMLAQLGKGIQSSTRQVEHFGINHENTFASLAELYKDTLSQLSYRIQVVGNPTYLQNSHTANKVRTLLLAGIRAAALWRQCGGHRWHLLVKRKALTQTITELKKRSY